MDETAIRAIHCELNPLTRSDGSALLSQGKTSVLASIIGPVEPKPQHLNAEKSFVECVFRPKVGLPNIKHKLNESIIRSTCETALLSALHPRTTISIQLQELDNCCGLEACAVNAACMALLAAGIPMRFSIAAVHCIIDKNNELILDPDYCQAFGSIASFLFVFDSLKRTVVTSFSKGTFDINQYRDAEMLSREASEIIFNFYRKIIERFQNKSF